MPRDEGPGADPAAADDGPETPDSPETIGELVNASIDEALARWDAAFGITPEDEAEAERDLDGFDARRHLASASTRAVNQYLADKGLSDEATSPLKITPGFIAEHGIPLMSVVFAAVEQAISGALKDQLEGRKTPPPPDAGKLALDLSDLFGPEDES